MAYEKITCESNISTEDILRLVLVTNGSDYALKTVLAGLDEDTLSYIRRLPDLPTFAQIIYINNFIAGVKADNSLTNLSEAFDYIHILGGLSNANANINIVNSGWYHQEVNAPTWTNKGYSGNGTTSYLDLSGYIINVDATAYSLNDAFLATYQYNNVGGGYDVGAFEATTTTLIAARNGANFTAAINNASVSNHANTDSRGLFSVRRVDATNISKYKNGVLVATVARTSTALASAEFYHLGVSALGSFSLGTTRTQSFNALGKATKVNPALFYTRVQTLATNLGWNA